MKRTSTRRTQAPRIPREEMPFCYAALARDAFARCVVPTQADALTFQNALALLKTKDGFLGALDHARIVYVFDNIVLPHEIKRWRVCVNKAYRVWSGLQRLERLNRQDAAAVLFNGKAA